MVTLGVLLWPSLLLRSASSGDFAIHWDWDCLGKSWGDDGWRFNRVVGSMLRNPYLFFGWNGIVEGWRSTFFFLYVGFDWAVWQMKFDDTLVNNSNFGDCNAGHTVFGGIFWHHSESFGMGEMLGTLENSAPIIVVGGASEKSSSIVLLTWKFLRSPISHETG